MGEKFVYVQPLLTQCMSDRQTKAYLPQLHVICHCKNILRYAVVTVEIISVFYFTCNHWWWLHVKYSTEIISKLFSNTEHVGNIHELQWASEIILKQFYFTCNHGINKWEYKFIQSNAATKAPFHICTLSATFYKKYTDLHQSINNLRVNVLHHLDIFAVQPMALRHWPYYLLLSL